MLLTSSPNARVVAMSWAFCGCLCVCLLCASKAGIAKGKKAWCTRAKRGAGLIITAASRSRHSPPPSCPPVIFIYYQRSHSSMTPRGPARPTGHRAFAAVLCSGGPSS